MTLQEKDKKNIWHPYTSLHPTFEPLLITSAEGIYLHAHDGKKIMDAISSWWVNLHGHSNPVIAEAIASQAKKLEHVIFAGFTHEPAIELSENLLSILPDNQSKIFFSDNGSTAVEVALKMAIQFWRNQNIQGKRKIIAIQGAYHGDTFGAMAVGGRSIFSASFEEYLFEVDFIDFPTENNEIKIEQDFRKLLEEGNVAAFIYEPLIQGAAGMRIYSPQILDKLLLAAREHDVVTIADEVFTGFGRTGLNFASDYLTNKPDIIALSKGITGGALPMGVTSCSHKIVKAFETNDALKTFYHGHSYTANPLSCAASNASFKILMGSECQQSIKEISESHRKFAQSIAGNSKLKNIQSLGTILSIELGSDSQTGYTNSLRDKIYPFFLERGILIRPLGNVIYVLPPYVITKSELNLIYAAIEGFVSEIN
jgi:adenosylmethionine-8-amino-7-oxononanoate transaminase